MSSPPLPPPRWLPAMLLAVLLLVTAAVYARVAGLGLAWDDHALVLDYGHLLADPRALPSLLLSDLWAAGDASIVQSGYYRPLMLLSLALDRALFGLWPGGYHLHSLLWHLLAVAALYRLLWALLGDVWAALCGATLLALHPLHAEAVFWIAARNDPMAAAFALLALGVLLPERASPGRLLLGGSLALLATLSKESALFLPVFLAALDLARGWALRAGWPRLLALALGVGGALLLRVLSGVGAGELPLPATLRFFAGLLPELLALLLSMLALPWPLSGGRSLEWLVVPPGQVVLGLVVLLLGVLATVRMASASRRLALAGLVIAALGFVPALLPLAAKGLIGERYLYLPMAGLGLWLGALAGAWPRLGGGLALATALGGAVVISWRLPDWQSDQTLWQAALEDTPNPYVFAGMGHALNRDPEEGGDRVAAVGLFVDAMAAQPPYSGGCGVLVTAALKTGRPALAAQLGWWSLQRGCPQDDDFVGRQAQALAYGGDWDAAEDLLRGAGPDAAGRGDVVRAALAQRQGRRDDYARIVAGWMGTGLLEPQVEHLLDYGRPPE